MPDSATEKLSKILNYAKITFPIFFLLAFQCSFAQNTNDKNIALIQSAREASNQAIAKHDIDGISKFWYNDFVQTRGNSTSLTGKDTIVASWKKLFNDNPTVVYIRTPSQIIISTNDTLA